jgi:hypothetical protein
MNRLAVRAAILALSAWALAPAFVHTAWGAAGSTQAAPPDQQSQTTREGAVHMVEGCLSSIDDGFILTGDDGRTYQLTGNTTELLAHAGSEVRIWGHADSVRDAGSMVAAGPIRSLNVQRVRSLSSGCPTRRG